MYAYNVKMPSCLFWQHLEKKRLPQPATPKGRRKNHLVCTLAEADLLHVSESTAVRTKEYRTNTAYEFVNKQQLLSSLKTLPLQPRGIYTWRRTSLAGGDLKRSVVIDEGLRLPTENNRSPSAKPSLLLLLLFFKKASFRENPLHHQYIVLFARLPPLRELVRWLAFQGRRKRTMANVYHRCIVGISTPGSVLVSVCIQNIP